MKQAVSRWADRLWYQNRPTWLRTLLLPLSALFRAVVTVRVTAYRRGWLQVQRMPCPVIIVGNLSVGGTGKTPLVLWLVEQLRAAGFQPGIISRGYGGQAESWPQLVTPDSDAQQVGDEALMLAQRANCPVAVGPDRPADATLLIEQHHCDILISDDGLQHYALGRDIEIAVVDGQRRFGNGYCLPAGPLREPEARLQQVDLIVCNGAPPQTGEYAMYLQGAEAVQLISKRRCPLQDFQAHPLIALAGIGHPERFFKHLEGFDLQFQQRVFPDHHTFQATDLACSQGSRILMTEKDAVKCRSFADARHWYVPVSAQPDIRQPLFDLLEKTCGKSPSA